MLNVRALSALTLLQVLCGVSVGKEDLNESRKTRHASPGRFVVKLHRQRVPVEGDAEVMSYKTIYFGTIYLGSPIKQEFSVVFDTGSGHVIVPSIDCESLTCRIHRQYNRRASLHAADIDYDGTLVLPGQERDQVNVAFGTGEVTGQLASDRLCLSNEPGEIRDQDNCIQLRIVMAIEMTHDPFHAFAFDGVLGLGLDGLTLTPEFSFFGQMLAQGQVARSTFAVFLAEGDDEQSEICIGGHSQERLQSELMWAPVALPELGYWQVRINRVRVGNKTLDLCNDGECRAVVDTGTSLLAVPVDFAEGLDEELTDSLRDPPSSRERGVDCRDVEGALLHFDLDGFTLTLTAGDYARQAVMRDESITESGTRAAGQPQGTQCRPTLMPIEMPAPIGPKLFIWGEPVLRKYYTVYDLAEKRIGFGLAAHSLAVQALQAEHGARSRGQGQLQEPAPAARRPLLKPLLL